MYRFFIPAKNFKHFLLSKHTRPKDNIISMLILLMVDRQELQIVKLLSNGTETYLRGTLLLTLSCGCY